MPYDAFLSYSSQDKTIADAMCHYLEQRGLRCWIAPRDVRPGEDYAAEIIDAIMASRALVVVFSANANASKHVKSEVERAVSHGIVVIPFRTEEVQPSKTLELFLGAKHWLDAMSLPLEPLYSDNYFSGLTTIRIPVEGGRIDYRKSPWEGDLR
jgi:hypothetical protein